MRTVKEFNISHVKCTLFHHNMKYSLQIEDDAYSFILKLGDKEAKQLEQLEEVTNRPVIIQYIQKSFSILHDTRLVMEKELNIEGDEFEEVII